MNKSIKSEIAIIGATGNVGRRIVEIILQRKLITPTHLKLFASKNSAGKRLTIGNHEFDIHDPNGYNFQNTAICLFATESDISKNYTPKALEQNVIVIDSSSHYRLDSNVPLIVAPVNKNLIAPEKHRLYAMANCVASPVSIVLKPLHDAFTIKRVNLATYQSTSGAGKGPMDELLEETKRVCENKPYQRQHFARQIAFNVIPQIDKILDDGSTKEEFKISREIQKILATNFAVTATSVRVPVMIGHSVALSIEFENSFKVEEIRKILEKSPSVTLSPQDYTTPIEVVGSDNVHVGRIRKDHSVPHGLHLWLCSDNLRRGAATDAVEVMERLITL